MLLSNRNLFFSFLFVNKNTTKTTTRVTNCYVGTVYAMFIKILFTFGCFLLFSLSTRNTSGKTQ